MKDRIELERIRMLEEERIALYSGSNILLTSGTVVKPTLSYNSGTRELTVGNGLYRTFLSTDFTGVLKEYSVEQTVLTLLDNTKYYICATYNNGNPIVYTETDLSIANDSEILVIYTLFTEGNELDVLDWGFEAVSLSNKINERLIDTNRFGIVGGFGLSASTRIITIAGGEFYLGSNKIAYNSIASNINECELIWRNGSGGFSEQDVTIYPNTQYDDGSGTLVTLTDAHYGIVWVWKSAGNPIEMYIMLGDQSYANLELAKSGKTPPDLPDKISLGSFLVGRIIFQKSSFTAITESAFDTVFNANSPTQHNSLLGLSGGGVGEYYHLNLEKYNIVQNISGTNTGDETQSTILSKIGYTPEDVTNKAVNFLVVNDTLYPSVKAVEDRVDAINHNDVGSKQGGTTNEYYHLTNSELLQLIKLNTTISTSSKAIVYSTANNNNTITATEGYVKLVLTLASEDLSGFTLDGANSRLVYVPTKTKRFFFNATATLSGVTTNNTVINFRVYKNGTPLINTTSSVKLDSSTSLSTINAASGFLLNQNDYIEIWADVDKNVTFTTSNLQLQITEDLTYSYNN